MVLLLIIQLKLANESDSVLYVTVKVGWGVFTTIAVTEGLVLVQLPKLLILTDVEEKSLGYMLVEKQMDK